MNESDIMLSVGVDLGDVQDAFQMVEQFGNKAWNQDSLIGYIARINQVVAELKIAQAEMAKFSSMGLTPAGMLGGEAAAVNNQIASVVKNAQVLPLEEEKALRRAEAAHQQFTRDTVMAQVQAEDSLKQVIQDGETNREQIRKRSAASQLADQERLAGQQQMILQKANDNQERSMQRLEDQITRQYGGGRFSMADRADAGRLLRDIGTAGGFAPYAEKTGQDLETIRTKATAANEVLKTMPTSFQRMVSTFGQHIVQWGAYAVALTVAFTIIAKIEQTFSKAIKDAAEFQSQSVNFQRMQDIGRSSGLPYQTAGTPELLTDSIALAEKYGDNINDVAEAMQLWYKQTGSLNNALFMTNEALKVQLATGLDLEDFYRGFTAIAFQAQGIKLRPGSKETFGLGQSPELANMLYTAAMYGGAGMGIQHEQSADGINKTSNAMETLTKASEQDTSALGKLHLTMQEIIAVNQGMILAMGNQGAGADAAAEHIGRLIGGIEQLSKVSNATSFQKNIGAGDFTKFQEVMNTGQGQGDFLQRFAKFYEELDPHAKAVLATTISSQRNFETTSNIVKVILGNLENIEKVEKNTGALDKTANEMQDTYNTILDKTAAKWQAVTMIIGMELLPLLSRAIGAMGGMFSGFFENLAKAQDAAHNFRSMGIGGLKTEWNPQTQEIETHPVSANPQLDDLRTRLTQAAMQKGLLSQTGPPTARQEHVQKIISGSDGYQATLEQLAKEGLLPELLGPNAPELTYPGAVAGGIARGNAKLDDVTKGLWDEAQYKKFMAMHGAEGSGDVIPNPAVKAGKLGPDTVATALHLQNAEYELSRAKIEARNAELAKEASIDEKSAGRYGMSKELMTDLTRIYTSQLGPLENLARAEEHHALALEHQVAALQKKAAKDTGSQRNRDLNDEAKAIQEQARAYGQQATTLNQIADIQYNLGSLPFQHAQHMIEQAGYQIDPTTGLPRTAAISQLNNQFSSTQDLGQKGAALSALTNLQTQSLDTEKQALQYAISKNVPIKDQIGLYTEIVNLQNDINTKTKEYNDEITSVNNHLKEQVQNYQDQILKIALPLSGYSPAQQAYIEAQAEINKENLKYAQELHEYQLEGVSPEVLSGMEQLHTLWVNTSEAAAAYREKLADLQSLPVYSALSNAFQDLIKYQQQTEIMGLNGPVDIAGGAFNQLTGVTAAQEYLQVLQNQNQALTNQKDILGYIYNSQITHTQAQKEAYDLENLQIQDQIKNLQTIEQNKQYALQHPGEFQTIADAFNKNFLGSISSQFTSSVFPLLGGAGAPQTMTQVVQQMMGPSGPLPNLTNAINNQFAPGAAQILQAAQILSGGGGPGGAGGTYNATVNGSMDVNVNSPSSGSGMAGGWGSSGISGGSSGGGGLAGGWGSALGLGVAGGAGVGAIYGAQAGATQAMAGTGASIAATGNVDMGPNGSWTVTPPTSSAPNVGPFGSGFGFGGHAPTNVMGFLGAAADVYGLYQDVASGPGGLQGGITGAEYGAQIGSMFGPWGAPIGAAAGFLMGFFGGNHDVPANMPDKYDTARFTLYVGELQGAAGTAYGPPFNRGSDPVIQALGGKSMLQFIQSWIVANINSSDPVKKKLATQLKPQYGTTGGGLNFQHDIADESVKGGSLSGTYVSIYTAAQQAIQEIMTLTADSAQPNQLVALNQFGGGGSFIYSWDTPGYEAPSTPPGTYNQGGSQPPPTGGTGSPPPPGGGTSAYRGGGSTAGPSGGSVGSAFLGGMSSGSSGGRAAYGYSAPSLTMHPQPILLNHTSIVPLDGRVLARVVQSYNIRTNSQGISRISI